MSNRFRCNKKGTGGTKVIKLTRITPTVSGSAPTSVSNTSKSINISSYVSDISAITTSNFYMIPVTQVSSSRSAVIGAMNISAVGDASVTMPSVSYNKNTGIVTATTMTFESYALNANTGAPSAKGYSGVTMDLYLIIGEIENA